MPRPPEANLPKSQRPAGVTLLHDYLGVDLDVVFRIVEHDVPRLKRACPDALEALSGPS